MKPHWGWALNVCTRQMKQLAGCNECGFQTPHERYRNPSRPGEHTDGSQASGLLPFYNWDRGLLSQRNSAPNDTSLWMNITDLKTERTLESPGNHSKRVLQPQARLSHFLGMEDEVKTKGSIVLKTSQVILVHSNFINHQEICLQGK